MYRVSANWTTLANRATVSVAAEPGGSDMRQWLGAMTAGDADNQELLDAALDHVILSLLGPESEFDLCF